jgi:hypothetical protein
VINFFDWPLDADHDDPKKPKGPPYAADYPDCFEIVEEKVKPDRIINNYSKTAREKWWLYERSRPELYRAIAECVGAASPKENRVLACALVSKRLIFTFSNTDKVFAHKLAIFPCGEASFFAIMQSAFHVNWAWHHSSTMRDAGINYSPSDCFETFPFPDRTDTLEAIGERYYTHRQTIMQTRQQGLTKTYNRFHDPTCTDPDIQTLRDLHIQMDKAVAAAYGWHDLISPRSPGRGAGGEGLNHDFHDTKQGLRFTISETARREILDRLLALNHQRYAEEVAQGLHDKKKGKGKGKIQKAKGKKPPAENPAPDSGQHTVQGSLFGDDGPTQGELF